MIKIELPRGAAWVIEDAKEKLVLRAGLPGARVFDHCAEALREAKALGLPTRDRLVLALPASWMVNNPANSQVMRRWALSPHRENWIALVEALEVDGSGGSDVRAAPDAKIAEVLPSLGQEPFVMEAASKILALLVPDVVPLCPKRARDFVLGDGVTADASALSKMIAWLRESVEREKDALAKLAHDHDEVNLSPAQVLDRLLWFDSEGYEHFP